MTVEVKTRRYSERELDLPEQWFTGEEWENGTAEREYRKLYREAKRRLESEKEFKNWGGTREFPCHRMREKNRRAARGG
jgi:hypothetical protein